MSVFHDERTLDRYTAEIARLNAKAERLQDALELVQQWTEAYPLNVFPEPDWKLARKLLEAGGMTLDSVSAGAMRHVVDGIGRITREALDQ